jgi:predicted DNA-binding antitoxin AbrB/MazE fold protein
MSETIKAIFQNGVFIPQQPCNLPEGSEVKLIVHDPYTIQPEVTDPAERAALLKEIVQGMKDNPIPANAPRFTREELHERR